MVSRVTLPDESAAKVAVEIEPSLAFSLCGVKVNTLPSRWVKANSAGAGPIFSIRPFGCRMFFCDATAAEWQNQTYERFHTQLKTLHHELSIPYYYVEWRSALSALGLNG